MITTYLRKYIFLILILFVHTLRAQYVSISTTNNTATDLVNKLIGNNNNCISISNAKISGWNSGGIYSYGYINSNRTNFEINDGILLSTGNVSDAVGSYTNTQSFGDKTGWAGDSDLENAANITATTNATILEFDFVPNTNKISFDYMFLSEQYLRQGDSGSCGYTDGFAFLIKKNGDPNYQNLAVIPNTNTPITSQNVLGPGGRCNENNAQYFGHFNPNGSPISFNGQTAILTAQTDVIPGDSYHIKLVIADQGNGLYDSGVIIKAGSFLGNKDLGTDKLIANNTAICQGNTITLDATSVGATYQWYKDGNEISGASSATYTVNSTGKYDVMIYSSSCNLKGSITVEFVEKAIINPQTFTNCDTALGGQISVKLQDLNPIIISNYKTQFNVKYYKLLTDANAGNTNTLPNDWSYNADTTIFVRVENGICAPEIHPITFKFGNKIPTNDITEIVCDDDLNNSQDIHLSDYLSKLSSETGFSYQFYKTKNDADLEQNSTTDAQTISADATFYARLKKSGFCDNVATITLKFNQPTKSTTLPDTVTVCEGDLATLDAGTGFSGYSWSNGATSQTISVGKGDYFVTLTSANSCSYTQKVSVVDSPKAIIDLSKFNTTVCDDDLDGTIKANLDQVTSAILLNPGIYRVKYYSDINDANLGNSITLNPDWSSNIDTTIFVRIESDYCPAQIYPLDFKFGNKIPLITTNASTSECDDNLDGTKTVNLDLYKTLFTNDNSVSVKYFVSESDAKNNVNPISSSQNVTNIRTFYLRFESNSACANWSIFTININLPTASTSIQDLTICKNTTTTIDAGLGFTHYKWSNGTDGQFARTADYGIGTHFVELTSPNGCVYKQTFTISATESPKITNIEVIGTTATISVTGGEAPYQYSIDGINYQSSNIFYNIPRGTHTVYVKDSKACEIIQSQFLIINLINAITPNGDGINDVLDYSDLRIKDNVSIKIFDRHGDAIYQSEGKNYIWDGKSFGRNVTSGTYWYVITWTEPLTQVPTAYSGWILVKNRN